MRRRAARPARGAGLGSSEVDKPLRRITASFEELVSISKQQPVGAMDAGAFARACSNVCVLFGCLGIAFEFAERDYITKRIRQRLKCRTSSGHQHQ